MVYKGSVVYKYKINREYVNKKKIYTNLLKTVIKGGVFKKRCGRYPATQVAGEGHNGTPFLKAVKMVIGWWNFPQL